MTIQPARIRLLNGADVNERGQYVLYLLQQANRSHFNPALELAVEEANRLDLPVIAAFGLLDGSNGFPEANARHYAFLLEGLADADASLAKRGIGFVMRKARLRFKRTHRRNFKTRVAMAPERAPWAP